MLVSRHHLLAFAVGLMAATAACSAQGGGEDSGRESYVAAVEATAECVEGDGYTVGEVTQNPDGLTYGFAISSPDGGEDDAALESVYDRCSSTHLRDTEREYLSSAQLSGPEKDAAYEELGACLETAGVPGVQVGDSEDVVTAKIVDQEQAGADSTPAWDCLDRYLIPLYGI